MIIFLHTIMTKFEMFSDTDEHQRQTVNIFFMEMSVSHVVLELF